MSAEILDDAPHRGLYMTFRAGLRGTLMLVAAAAFITGLVSLLWPKTYRAEAVILPNFASGTKASLLDLAAGSGLGDILAGSMGPVENPVLTYPEILHSRTVLERTLLSHYPRGGPGPGPTVLEAIGVAGRSERQRLANGVVKLRALTTVRGSTRSGFISVAAETPDSVLSAFIVDQMLQELNRFNVESRASQGTATREFVQARLAEARGELTSAEGSLASFRQANLRIDNSPQLLLEQARLQREVETRADLVRLLARQYEVARIEEKRDTPTFSVIESAQPPIKKYRPRILFNMMVAVLLALGLRVGFAALWPNARTARTPG